MSFRRVVAILLVLGAIVAAILWWRAGDRTTSSTSPKTSTIEQATRAKLRAGASRHAWRGQRNAKERRIAGIVLHDGAPVEGATVLLRSELTSAGAIPEPRVVTKADGRFDFGLQIAATAAVLAEKPALAPAVAWIDVRDPRASTEDLTLVLHACDASIHGTIRDAAGGVVPHARVALLVAAFGTSGGAEADDKGAYEICVPVGSTTVVVSADGYARTSELVEAIGAVRRDFALVPAASVVGRVVRASDRTPIANAIVELRPEPMPGSSMSRALTLRAVSDDSGAFHIDGVMPGPYAIVATADGLASLRPAYVVAEIGETPEEVVCLLGETHTISGKVIEDGTKKPIDGITVWMRPNDDSRAPTETTARTQADGSFAIEVVPGEYVPMVARHELRNTLSNVVVSTKDVDVVLVIERYGSISGRVTAAGKPVAGAEIGLRGPSRGATQSEHDGRFELRDVKPGTYQLYAESKRVGAFTPGPQITLAKGEDRKDVAIEMDLAGSVAGVVVDQDDKPVAGVIVSFSLLRGADFGLATTAEDGSFRAGAMAGGGDYVYEVRPAQRSQIRHPPAVGKRFPPIAVRDGATHVTGLRIKIRREQLAITGRVLDAAGKPLAGARLEVEPEMYAGQPVMSDDTGAFTVHGLPAGTYNLQATFASRETHVANIATGRTDVVLKFADTGVIEGTLEGFTDEPDITVDGGRFKYRATITGKTFRVRDVSAGAYRITASSPTALAAENVVLDAGATQKITLRAAGFGSIAGTLIDEATKQPKPNTYCEAAVNDGGRFDSRTGTWTRTDARGNFRIDRVAVGPSQVFCGGAEGTVEVVAGQTARIDLVAKTRAPRKVTRNDIGMELENQLTDVMVKSVVAGGPAARAGFLAGDVIEKIDNGTVDPYSADMLEADLQSRTPGTTVRLAIERAGAQRVLELKIEAAP